MRLQGPGGVSADPDLHLYGPARAAEEVEQRGRTLQARVTPRPPHAMKQTVHPSGQIRIMKRPRPHRQLRPPPLQN